MINPHNDRIADEIVRRMDRQATAVAALWYELEKRLGQQEVSKLRRWFQLVLNHTEPQVEQVIRVAQMAGAQQLLVIRDAQRIELLRHDDRLQFVDPPHPLIVLAVFEGDGGTAGIEVRS
jgi:hypothetical protein